MWAGSRSAVRARAAARDQERVFTALSIKASWSNGIAPADVPGRFPWLWRSGAARTGPPSTPPDGANRRLGAVFAAEVRAPHARGVRAVPPVRCPGRPVADGGRRAPWIRWYDAAGSDGGVPCQICPYASPALPTVPWWSGCG
ncbi:hypothetical protein GCM10010247_32430 [Streptomyces calvus]|nr:hypothetical protein GCM10010247_32430 [Streptomyces calvus]